jgi:hypothetical protein
VFSHPWTFEIVKCKQCCLWNINNTTRNQPFLRFKDGVVNIPWASPSQNPNTILMSFLNYCFILIPNVIWCIFVLCVHVFQVGIKGMACLLSKSFYLKTFSPFTSWILISRWQILNQYHQLALGTPFQNGVGLVYVTSTTFSFICYMVIDNLIVCMFKTQMTIVASSCFVNTPRGANFLLLVLPQRWYENEINAMF